MRKLIDIWFGPGALKGVFGAGVALGLERLFARGDLDATRARLYGASVGCLTATYLATSNASCGLAIFQEETAALIRRSNVVMATGARVVRRLAAAVHGTQPSLRAPSVLNTEHVFDVMMRRTPDIREELRRATIPVFAEAVRRTGEFEHTDLRAADDPFSAIRNSLNCFPFSDGSTTDLLDSVVFGYGFVELLPPEARSLIVVLNDPPSSRLSDTFVSATCAAICVDVEIARLYLRRSRNRQLALANAREYPDTVMLVYPAKPLRLQSPTDFERAYLSGERVASSILSFLHQSDAADALEITL